MSSFSCFSSSLAKSVKASTVFFSLCFVFVLALLGVFSAAAPAYAAHSELQPEGTYEGFNYTWDSSTGTLTVSAGENLGVQTEDVYEPDSIYKNDAIKHLVFSEGVKSVGGKFLYNCRGLEDVTIPASLESFGTYQYGYSSPLAACFVKGGGFLVAAGNANYCAIDGNLYSKDMASLYRYVQKGEADVFTLPSSVGLVYGGAFAYNSFDELVLGGTGCDVQGNALNETVVAKLVLAEGLEKVSGYGSISGLQSSTLNFPSTLKEITTTHTDSYQWLFNPSISAYTVSAGNTVFKAIDGVLIKDSTLWYYPVSKAGESYTTPSSVTSIGSSSFGYDASVQNLKELTLSPEVTSIKSDGIKVGASIERVFVMNPNCSFNYSALRATQLSAYSTKGATLYGYIGSTAQVFSKSEGAKYSVKGFKTFFTEDMVSASPLKFTYDGQAHCPTIDAPLLNGEYTLIPPADATSAGKKIVQVVAGGDFYGTVDVEYAIEGSAPPTPVQREALGSIVLGSKTVKYTGSVVMPSVVVKNAKGVKLTKGVDYTVSCKSLKVGKATLTVTGIGKYAGTRTEVFKILPKTASIKSAKAGKKCVVVKTAAGVSATGGAKYQISYRVKGASKWKTVSTTSKSKTIKYLKKSKKYQVRVRAFAKVGGVTYYGAWSSVKTTAKVM